MADTFSATQKGDWVHAFVPYLTDGEDTTPINVDGKSCLVGLVMTDKGRWQRMNSDCTRIGQARQPPEAKTDTAVEVGCWLKGQDLLSDWRTKS